MNTVTNTLTPTPIVLLAATISLPTRGHARPPQATRVVRAVKLLDLPPAKDAEADISADGRFVARASGGKRAALVLWDLSTKKRRWSKRIAMPKQDGQTRVLSSPDGRFVALAVFSRRRGRLQVYRAETGRRVLSDSFPRDAKKALQQLFTWRITPGNLLIARFAESLRVYDLARGKRRFAISGCGTSADQGGGQEEGAPMIDFSQDERFVTTTHWGMEMLRLWSLKTGKLHKELKLHTCKDPDAGCGTGSIFVAFVASTPPLVMASGLYGAVWELPSGRRRFVFDDTVYATATKLTPEYEVIGTKLLLETSKGTVERDLQTGRARRRVSPYPSGYRMARVSQAGVWRLLQKAGAPTMLWHEPTRRPFALLDGRGKLAYGIIALVGPPGRQRAMTLSGRTVWAWPLLSKLAP